MNSIKDEGEIRKEGMRRMLEEVENLCDEIKAGVSDSDKIMSIFDLERIWTEHSKNTSQIYSDIISDMISATDQSELIKRKKENTERKE